jgi:hypothetical protein
MPRWDRGGRFLRDNTFIAALTVAMGAKRIVLKQVKCKSSKL